MQVNFHDRVVTPADHAACRTMIRAGSRSFFAASLLLPREVRQPALALYAFCRLADDAVDMGQGCDTLNRLRERLALAYAGRPADSAADRGLARVVTQFAIPRALPEALLEGFQWDLEGRRYEDGPQLFGYAARVAGSVGAMMACLMDTRCAHAVARACDLGVAMQLTNIARDVGEDARARRLYLPLSWLRDAAVDPDDWLQRPVFTPGIASVVNSVLATADTLYQRAGVGISMLPRDCRRGIRAARYLYAGIGHELQRHGLDSVSRRTVVPPRRKAALLARAIVCSERGGASAHPALLETQFLVDAVAAEAHPAAARRPAGFDGKMQWLADLFERLARRDQRQPDGAT